MRKTVLFLFVPILCVGLAAVAGSSASTNRAVAAPPAAKQIAALKRQVAAQRKQITTLKASVKGLQAKVAALSPEGIAAQLARVKVANDKYQSVDAAKSDGYVAGSPCEKSPEGGMGIHYVNPAALADPAIDPMKPEILTYQPTASGLVLLAAEYFKADADQNLSTDTDRPTLFGRAFDGPMPGHSPTMPRHYDLHVWLWKHNPSGMFAIWNPDVACP
jgi:TolA-binding protein